MKTSTPSWEFSLAAKKAGLHYPLVSVEMVKLLLQVQAEPLPVTCRPTARGHAPSPSPKCSIGPLIKHGLAKLEGALYVVTEKGADYIKKLRESGLI